MRKILILVSFSIFCLSVFAVGPIAVNDSVWIAKHSVLTFNPLTNDTINTSVVNTVTVIKIGAYDTAYVNSNNQLNIINTEDFLSQDTIIYSVCNPANECDTAMILLNIGLRANDESEVGVNKDSATVKVNVLANDNNFTADSLSMRIIKSTKFTAYFVDSILVLDRNITGSCGIDTVVYEICAGAICDSASLPISSDCYVEEYLPTGFSPNGDGINDKLVFKFLDNSKPVILNIFNRYGDLIYENNDYGNDWDGIPRNFKKAATDGSYWYTVRTRGKQYIQYLVIQR